MREHLTLPNLITTGNLACGFVALLLLPSHVALSAVLVVAAAVFDSIDGPMARRRGKDQTFGMTLDSLADLVSFGVVPAMGLFLFTSPLSQPLGVVVALLFAACGAWRLARYPLVKSRGHFVGLPIPVAGIAVMTLLALGPVFDLSVLIAVALGALLSGLMVSSVRFPTVGDAPHVVRSAARRVARRS